MAKIKVSDLGPGVTGVVVDGHVVAADADGMIEVSDEYADALAHEGKRAHAWHESRNRVANTASPVALTSEPETLEMPPEAPDDAPDEDEPPQEPPAPPKEGRGGKRGGKED